MKTWQKLRNNPALWERYFIREKVLTAIRRFFLDRNFHEVETPYLTASLPPESYVDIFETTLLDRDRRPTRAYLPTSPEPFLKKLLVAGIGNCFALPKSFRNTEDKSTTHNPEFTILEWYRINADYADIMKDCEELLVFVHTYLLRSKNHVKGKYPTKLSYQGNMVDLSVPWERITVNDAFKQHANVDLAMVWTRDKLAELARKKAYSVQPQDTWEILFNQIFLNEVVTQFPKNRPTIIYDYPVQLAALAAKPNVSDPRFVERFELYIGGIELADCCSELTDVTEQQNRFKQELQLKKLLGKTEYPVDNDFIQAIELGLPKCAGIALGVDRLLMLFADVDDIADTMFFPMKDLFES